MSDREIRIAGVVRESVVDGPGLRAVVFFQGCPHRCPGCHNPETWDFNGGTIKATDEIWDLLRYTPLLSGITLSGGEPFLQPAGALALAEKTRSVGGNIVIYTGYLWEELLARPEPEVQRLLDITFLIVDGPFKQEEKEAGLVFRGSRNQRLIDVQRSLRDGKAVLWKESPTKANSHNEA